MKKSLYSFNLSLYGEIMLLHETGWFCEAPHVIMNFESYFNFLFSIMLSEANVTVYALYLAQKNKVIKIRVNPTPLAQ